MSEFDKIHIETVQEFLNGVVVIDDNIKFTEAPAEQLETPDDDELGAGDVNPTDNSEATRPENTPIHARALIDPFSEIGIHCVACEWNEETNELPAIALNTDIAIFDWKLSEGGTPITAELLIKELIEKSKNSFRYIVIYTSETSNDVATKIKDLGVAEYSSDFNEEDNIVDLKNENESHVSIRIEIIEKADDSELCEKVITGFSNFSSGFLRNATLNGITSIRKNTFKLLSLYPKKLDKAAISHFTSLQSSSKMFDQAEISFHDYISGLISDNISDILLYSEGLKASISKDTIVNALDKKGSVFFSKCKVGTQQLEYLPLIKSESHASFKSTALDNLQRRPDQKLERLKKKINTNLGNGHDSILIEDNINHLKELSHDDCCINRAIFSSPEEPHHPLKFGTIIKNAGTYYMCLQPLCDSIRLSTRKPTTFPFVKLKKREDSYSFDFVLKINSKFIGFKAVDKPHQSLKSFDFKANSITKDVRTNNESIFSGNNNEEFTWIAELKLPYAQELAQTIANGSTRVGMDKFEWLRKK